MRLPATPSACRNSFTALARRSPSARLYSSVPRSSALPSMVTCRLESALRQRAERCSDAVSAGSISAELKGKCTRTCAHSASPAEMSVQRPRMQSCRSPHSRSAEQIFSAGDVGDELAAAGELGAVELLLASLFVSGLWAQAANSVSRHKVRMGLSLGRRLLHATFHAISAPARGALSTKTTAGGRR